MPIGYLIVAAFLLFAKKSDRRYANEAEKSNERSRQFYAEEAFKKSQLKGNTTQRSASLALATYRKDNGKDPATIAYWQEIMGFPPKERSGKFDAQTLDEINNDTLLERMFG